MKLEWRVNILKQPSANVLVLLWLHKSLELFGQIFVNSKNSNAREFSKAPTKMMVF